MCLSITILRTYSCFPTVHVIRSDTDPKPKKRFSGIVRANSVATLKDLTELRLGGSAVTGRGLERLKGLRKLERLSLQDAKRVADDAVFVLASFHGLRWLDLKGTGMTDKTVAELRRQLPKCQILY